MRSLDLTGQVFGFLGVEEKTERRDGSNIVYRCTCLRCGKECFFSTRALRSQNVKSCGCYRRSLVGNYWDGLADHVGQVDHTNRSRIKSKAVQKNNTSGVRGVSKTKNGWASYIYFQKKRIRLYSGPDKEEAIRQRKLAEEQIFGEYLSSQGSR